MEKLATGELKHEATALVVSEPRASEKGPGVLLAGGLVGPSGVTGGGGFDPTQSRWEHRGCPQWGSRQPHGTPRVSAGWRAGEGGARGCAAEQGQEFHPSAEPAENN